MAFIDQWTLANDATFQHRVQVATVKSAIAVLNEAVNTAGHVDRFRFARDVVGNPDAITARMALAVVTNPAINGSSTDGDIEFTVNSVWDALSGVGPT